ncbi:MAG: type I secretion C-terminal target domain-containing protein [Candidatus Berkiella sp.]
MNNQFSMAGVIEQYGLHACAFGAIPFINDYERFLQLQDQGEYRLFAINIQKELKLVKSNPNARLCISVPTRGFTDPLLDYVSKPLFAIPTLIDGAIAKEFNTIHANVTVTDIAQNHYPLLKTKNSDISFEQIEKNLIDKKDRFTTLDQITFEFTAEQLVGDNWDTRFSNKKDLLELLIPCSFTPFDFKIYVAQENKILRETTVHYPGTKLAVLKSKLMAIWQEGNQKSYLHINFKIAPHQHAARAKVIIEVPLQSGVNYTWESAPSIKGKNSKSIRFTQYYGLSANAFEKVICAIVNPSLFEARFMSCKKQKTEFRFNRYDAHPELWHTLYDHIIQGVLNQSVPLFALSPYFASYDEIKNAMEEITWQYFDEHDQFVFKKLYEILITNTSNMIPFIDEVDRLLSLMPEYCETTLVLETMGKHLSNEQFNLKAHFILENSAGKQVLAQDDEATLQILRKNRQLSVVNSKAIATQGAVYHLNLNHLESGAHVIEDFNMQANDKINLSDLMNALSQSGGSSVIHAQITPSGDTEIWVEHHTLSSRNQYHIATLKGMNIPCDISHFIQVGKDG